jgi:hypothetical protein
VNEFEQSIPSFQGYGSGVDKGYGSGVDKIPDLEQGNLPFSDSDCIRSMGTKQPQLTADSS